MYESVKDIFKDIAGNGFDADALAQNAANVINEHSILSSMALMFVGYKLGGELLGDGFLSFVGSCLMGWLAYNTATDWAAGYENDRPEVEPDGTRGGPGRPEAAPGMG